MLEILNYNKSYGKKEVLKNINLNLENGKVYGLVGDNGVGKTTLLQSISNFKIGYSGEIVLENQEQVEKIVYISEDMFKEDYYTDYKLNKFFNILSNLYINWDSEYNKYLLDKFDVNLDQKYRKMSKGEKNLINLIIGLSTRGKVSIFDEPTSGLDAKTRYKFYQLLMEDLEKNPRIVIISTHIIDEAANYFDEVIYLANKEVKLFESLENINNKSKAFTGTKENMKILNNKNIISKEEFGSMEKYYIYDEFSEIEMENYQKENLTVENISLQNLLVHFN